MHPLAAVLSGDLIDSSQSEPAQVDATLNTLENTLPFIVAGAAGTRFTRNRGDGWQIHLADPGNAYRVSVCLTATLRSDPDCLATRIAIGIGTVTNPGTAGFAGASGEAFTASGRALDKMKPGQTLAIAGTGADPSQQSQIAFTAHVMSGWSREQAEVVALMIRHGAPNHQVIADLLGITRQAVGARLHSAGYKLLCNASLAFRDYRENLARSHA